MRNKQMAHNEASCLRSIGPEKNYVLICVDAVTGS